MITPEVRALIAAEAEKFCVEMGKLIQPRTDGQPTTFINVKAVAELNSNIGFKRGAESFYLRGMLDGLARAAEVLPTVDCSTYEVQDAERPCCAALQVGIDAIRALAAELSGEKESG